MVSPVVKTPGPSCATVFAPDSGLADMRLNAQDRTIVKLFNAYQKRGMAKDNAVMLIAASLSMTRKEVWDVVYRVEGHV